MRVTINLAKGSRSTEVVQILRALKAVHRPKRSHLNLYDLINTGVYRLVNWACHGLAKAVQPLVDRICCRAERLQQRLAGS